MKFPKLMKRGEDVAAGVPIVGLTGPNGKGKTILAVNACIADMRDGRPVYSTVAIRSSAGDSKPIRSLRELLELPHGATILLDDIASMFSSRTSQSVPPEVVTFMHTVRHKDQRLIWTAPGWMRADVNVRLVTQAAVNVVALWSSSVKGSPWPRTRVAGVALLDTTTGKPDAMPERVMRRRIAVLGRLDAFGAYDSQAPVPQLGGHVHTGTCPDCGGTRSRPKHSPELHAQLGLPWFDDVESPSGVPVPLVFTESGDHGGAHGGLDDDPEQSAAEHDEEQQRQQALKVEGASVGKIDEHVTRLARWRR